MTYLGMTESQLTDMYRRAYDYARQRVADTGKAYIITKLGHCFMDDPHNRIVADAACDGIWATVKPLKRS